MDIEEAVRKAIGDAPARQFNESVDLAINLHNIDLSIPGNRVDAEVILPHGLGKPAKIAVFAAGETAMRAKSAGAHRVLSADDISAFGIDKRSASKLGTTFSNSVAYGTAGNPITEVDNLINALSDDACQEMT